MNGFPVAAWGVLPDETPRAYAAFCKYIELPPAKRSLAEVCRVLGKSEGYVGQLERWSAKNAWVARAKAYDEQMQQQSVRTLEETQKAIRQEELTDYENERDAWRRMLTGFRLHELEHEKIDETTDPNGRTVVIITRFMKLRTLDMARMAQARLNISKLGRRAAGMTEESIAVEFTDEVVRLILAGEIEYDVLVEFVGQQEAETYWRRADEARRGSASFTQGTS
ncbi:MAG: hypothetical protein SF123_19580 [Chloroflexota bacterium]|nr:hypothetical protein [Chloroflexota bacterium]